MAPGVTFVDGWGDFGESSWLKDLLETARKSFDPNQCELEITGPETEIAMNIASHTEDENSAKRAEDEACTEHPKLTNDVSSAPLP